MQPRKVQELKNNLLLADIGRKYPKICLNKKIHFYTLVPRPFLTFE